MKDFSIVVAVDEKNGIGKNGNLAWSLPADLKIFKEITTSTTSLDQKNVVIMGRKTWDSLPDKFRPLPGRLNVVLSRNIYFHSHPGGAQLVVADLEKAMEELSSMEGIENIFVIGGAQIYLQAIRHPACKTIYLTQLKANFSCDAFFPEIPASFNLKKATSWVTESPVQYRFCQYQKVA